MEQSSSQGRYFLLNTPVASPGQCGICGFSGPERRYLDPQLVFEWYGTLIFCSECVASMAAVFGFLTPELASTLEARLEVSESELIRTRAAIAAMEAFSVAVGSLGLDRSIIDRSDNSSVSIGEANGYTNQNASDDATGVSDGDSTPDVTSLLSGRDDVRDDSVDANFGL